MKMYVFDSHKLVVFQGIDMKLVTVLKILKRSLKWDQSGISSYIRLKVTSKTRWIVQKMGKFKDLYLRRVKNTNISKSATGKISGLFGMDLVCV